MNHLIVIVFLILVIIIVFGVASLIFIQILIMLIQTNSHHPHHDDHHHQLPNDVFCLLVHNCCLFCILFWLELTKILFVLTTFVLFHSQTHDQSKPKTLSLSICVCLTNGRSWSHKIMIMHHLKPIEPLFKVTKQAKSSLYLNGQTQFPPLSFSKSMKEELKNVWTSSKFENLTCDWILS